jgi:SAM-dependent methyltransferase
MSLRDAAISLASNRVSIALRPEEMGALVDFLGDQFGIRQPPNGFDLEATVAASVDEQAYAAFERASVERTLGRGEVKRAADAVFYELIADQPLLGLVHSTKFPVISDAAAYLSVILREANVSGPILDVGCGPGYHAMWLGTLLGAQVTGLEASPRTVNFASRKAAEVKVPARFMCARAPSLPAGIGKFRAVYSCDGPLQMTPEDLGLVSRLLAEDAVFVWIGGGSELTSRGLSRLLQAAGFELLLCDVLGGWDGKEYGAKTVLVLAKGRRPAVPRELRAAMTDVWEQGFRDYANTPGRAADRKSLAWFRTFSTFGCPSS